MQVGLGSFAPRTEEPVGLGSGGQMAGPHGALGWLGSQHQLGHRAAR